MSLGVGDLVKVFDNSYSLKVDCNDLKPYSNPGGVYGEESPVFEIIDTRLKLPSSNFISEYRDENNWNDTIIENIETGELYFVQSDFLKEAKVNKENKLKETTNDLKEELSEGHITFGCMSRNLVAISEYLLENN